MPPGARHASTRAGRTEVVLFSAIPFFVLMGVLGVGGYFALTREHRLMIGPDDPLPSSVSSKYASEILVHIGW